MGITDWDAWMKEHHIYIPTAEEMEEARRRNLVKVKRIHREMTDMQRQLKALKKKIEDHGMKEEWLARVSR